MCTEQIGEDLFLIDLQTAGYSDLFASYVLRGSETVIIDPGPASSISNLLSGLRELKIQPESVSYVALSHVHIDHSGCTGTLLRSLPNAKAMFILVARLTWLALKNYGFRLRRCLDKRLKSSGSQSQYPKIELSLHQMAWSSILEKELSLRLLRRLVTQRII